ncbi:MAG: cobaltochelatase subunit CobN [Veillonellales bacterium]
MGKILLLTNMEQQYSTMNRAKTALSAENLLTGQAAAILLNDCEIWSAQWEKSFLQCDFILFSWMGTGLNTPFLKKSAEFMRRRKIKHLYLIADPGDDILEYGITPAEKQRIYQYISFSGLANTRNLWLWLSSRFSQAECCYAEPHQLPWHGIYHPSCREAFTDPAEYRRRFCLPDRPTIAMIFSREEWIWGNLAYQTKIVQEIERQGYNPLLVFSNNLANPETGAPGLGEAFEKYFYDQGRVIIDVLINTFVFSLTVTRFLELKTILDLGVPVLQAYNLYNSYEWWQDSFAGMSPSEISYSIAMPEFDGIIHSVPVATREELADGTHEKQPMVDERICMLVRKAGKWGILRHKPNREKKIGIVFHNYPPTNSNIGSASCLDSPESIRLLLAEMKQRGYKVDHIPENSQAFMEELIAHATNDRRFITEKQIKEADGKLTAGEYEGFFAGLPEKTRQQMTRDWGEAPGQVFNYAGDLLIPGMLNGNVFITVQPPRGFGEDPGKIYHSPDCAPTHHYIGFYDWLRNVWQADALIHVGTHGSLEWLPGKGTAMSNGCYPDIAIDDMPNVYPYWITCVGEGIQAKRRSAACLISYLSAPMSIAGTYDELAELEKLLEEYCHFKQDAANTDMAAIQEMIRAKVKEANLAEDVPETAAADFAEYVGNLHVYITDIKNMQMSIGLHTLGCPPTGEHLTEYLLALTKVNNGDIPSLTQTLAGMFGFDYYTLLENSGTMLPDGSKTYGMLIVEIREKSREVILLLMDNDFAAKKADAVFALPWTAQMDPSLREQLLCVAQYICTQIAPGLLKTTQEITNLLAALDGEYIEPSPSGAPTSGGADLLPTGRNFYSVDPRTLPTPVAWEIGKQMADDVIASYIGEEGCYPESVGIILWATSNLRNHGQCVAEFLYLMGLRPVWQKGSLRVVDIEVIPLPELKRPRVDVTGRISGLFRDSMPSSVTWLDKAASMAAALDESIEENYIRKHVLQESGELEEQGMDHAAAWRQASYRIFGDPPGAHGAGVGALLEAKNWDNIDDIAKVYVRWGGHAYGEGSDGTYMPERFSKRMGSLDITVQNVDHRESSMLSGDDYNSYRGGMVAAVRSIKGEMPRNYVSDSSDRSKVVIRSLENELKRWFRGEAVNPKYINGMKEHGYKGAADMSTYVAVSYQWDATSDVMEDWMYEKYAEKYALDPATQEWMKEVNPWALHRIAETLLEAAQRGLWQAKAETKQELEQLFLSIEGELEERSDNK